MSSNLDDSMASVQVVVRLRPMSEKEMKGTNTFPVVTASTDKHEVTVIKGSGTRQQRATYSFDNVFTSFSTQKEVFEQTLEPVIADVLSGFECTMFAYGQTGTGKTYTMEGMISSEEECGVIPRSAMAIFERLMDPACLESSVTASYLEIYNEELTDLLADQGRDVKLQVVEDTSKRGKGVFVQNLSEKTVSSAEDVLRLMSLAQERRRVGETKMNKASSRSHCLFTLRVHSKRQVDQIGSVIECTGKLHLVDLAGSECAKTAGHEDAKVERERKNINQSLLTLGRVISALRDGNIQRIPYRDSKLTRLLQESLGGRCKTVIIATLSPSALAVEETTSTLNYAQAAQGIQNKPVAMSYLKVGEGAKPSAASTVSGSGATVQDWNQMECRLQYLQGELEEAQAALSRKHMQQQIIIDRAETAETQRDALSVDLEQATEVLEKEKVRAQKLCNKLVDARVDIQKKVVLLDARKQTETKLDSEARALLETLTRSVKESTELHNAAVHRAESDVNTRKLTLEMCGDARQKLNEVVSVVVKSQNDVQKTGEQGLKEITLTAQQGVEHVQSMLVLVEDLEAAVRESCDATMLRAKELTKKSSIRLDKTVKTSASQGQAILKRTELGAEDTRCRVQVLVDRVRCGETALISWAGDLMERLAEHKESLRQAETELCAQLSSAQQERSTTTHDISVALTEQGERLTNLRSAVERHGKELEESIHSCEDITRIADENLQKHVTDIGSLRDGLQGALDRQKAGQIDDKVLATIEEARVAESSRTAMTDSAIQQQNQTLASAVQTGRDGLGEDAVVQDLAKAQEVLDHGCAHAESLLKEQEEILSLAISKQANDNAEGAMCKSIDDMRTGTGEAVSDLQGRIFVQKEGLEAISRRLEGQKNDETGLVEALIKGNQALITQVEDQARTLAAQAALIVQQKKMLDAALARQKQGQTTLVNAVMTGLQSILNEQVSSMAAILEKDANELCSANATLGEQNVQLKDQIGVLNSDADKARANSVERVEQWGQSVVLAKCQVDDMTALNADISNKVTSLAGQLADHATGFEATVSKWGDSNRLVGASMVDSVAKKVQTIEVVDEMHSNLNKQYTQLHNETNQWANTDRTVHEMAEQAIEQSNSLYTDLAVASGQMQTTLTTASEQVTAWADTDRQCQVSMAKTVDGDVACVRVMEECRRVLRQDECALVARSQSLLLGVAQSMSAVCAEIQSNIELRGKVSQAEAKHRDLSQATQAMLNHLCETQATIMVAEGQCVNSMIETRPAIVHDVDAAAAQVKEGTHETYADVEEGFKKQTGNWNQLQQAEAESWHAYTDAVDSWHASIANEAGSATQKSATLRDTVKDAFNQEVKLSCQLCESVGQMMTSSTETVSISVAGVVDALTDYSFGVIKCNEEVEHVPPRANLPFSEFLSATPPEEKILEGFQPEAVDVDAEVPATVLLAISPTLPSRSDTEMMMPPPTTKTEVQTPFVTPFPINTTAPAQPAESAMQSTPTKASAMPTRGNAVQSTTPANSREVQSTTPANSREVQSTTPAKSVFSRTTSAPSTSTPTKRSSKEDATPTKRSSKDDNVESSNDSRTPKRPSTEIKDEKVDPENIDPSVSVDFKAGPKNSSTAKEESGLKAKPAVFGFKRAGTGPGSTGTGPAAKMAAPGKVARTTFKEVN